LLSSGDIRYEVALKLRSFGPPKYRATSKIRRRRKGKKKEKRKKIKTTKTEHNGQISQHSYRVAIMNLYSAVVQIQGRLAGS